jgi:hypothetical protein
MLVRCMAKLCHSLELSKVESVKHTPLHYPSYSSASQGSWTTFLDSYRTGDLAATIMNELEVVITMLLACINIFLSVLTIQL